MAARTCTFSVGLGLALGAVPWNTSVERRVRVDWLPRADTPFLNPNGTVSRPWYLFFKELAETRLGGIAGATIPQVAVTVVQTQAQAVQTAAYTDAAIAYARGVAAVAEATAEVAQNAALPGSTSIPPSPEPPPRPKAGTNLA